MSTLQRPLWTFNLARHGDDDAIPEELRGKKVADLEDGRLPEDLRGKSPDDLERMVVVFDAQLKDLHRAETGELRDKTPEEQEAFDYVLQLREKALDLLENHRKVQLVLSRKSPSVERAYQFAASGGRDDPYGDVRRMSHGEVRDAALRTLDDRNTSGGLSSDQKDHVERQIRRDPEIARRILVTENDDYRSAFMKGVTDANPIFTPEEQRALLAFKEFEARALAESPTSAGGFGIPVYIDPSIILTAQGSSNPFLQIAKQVTVNTNAWKGVSSAGVTWAFQSEGVATTDNSPTLAQPTVTVFMARGFLPYSIEIGQDYPGFADEMATLLASGYDELLVDKFTRGAGGLEPTGILTALSANTNVRVTVTTAPTIGAPDPYKVWQAVPQRFRRNASWLMSVDINNAIRQLGTANVYHASTVTLPEGWADALFNKGVYETPYMPGTTTFSTSTQGYAVVGDFSNYVIARRAGMSVELVPTLFDVTNNRPTGQRGWVAYARIGGNSVNDLGFRLLVAS